MPSSNSRPDNLADGVGEAKNFWGGSSPTLSLAEPSAPIVRRAPASDRILPRPKTNTVATQGRGALAVGLFGDIVQAQDNLFGLLAGGRGREQQDAVGDGSTVGGRQPAAVLRFARPVLGKYGDPAAVIGGTHRVQDEGPVFVELDAHGEPAVPGVDHRGVGDAAFIEERGIVDMELDSRDLDGGDGYCSPDVALQVQTKGAGRLVMLTLF